MRFSSFASLSKHKKARPFALGTLLVSALLSAYFFYQTKNEIEFPLRFAEKYSKSQLRSLLRKNIHPSLASPGMKQTVMGNGETAFIQYSIDVQLQAAVEEELKKSRAKYSAFVAMDPKTGQILAMASHGSKMENLALRATFPAASIFKVITAAAAIEKGALQHDSLIPMRGSFHTLYKRNVFSSGNITPEHSPRYARLISFEDALAKSVNSVFGKVGIFGVGPDMLKQKAVQFGFNRELPFEFTLDASQNSIPEGQFSLAEVASGYTKLTTLSPLHGALIASTIINDGKMPEPSIVQFAQDSNGETIYRFKQSDLGQVIHPATARELQIMMNRTVVAGTSRRSFRGMAYSRSLSDVFIGGKTGTLTGWDPPGKYDWFIGFGTRGNTKIAFASLCIHGDYHGVKASRIAREALETYFRSMIASRTGEIESRRVFTKPSSKN